MAKLTIKEKGWESFNGMLGAIKFQNGESVSEVSPQDCERIAASMRCVITGTEKSPSPSQVLIDQKDVSIAVEDISPLNSAARPELTPAEQAAIVATDDAKIRAETLDAQNAADEAQSDFESGQQNDDDFEEDAYDVDDSEDEESEEDQADEFEFVEPNKIMPKYDYTQESLEAAADKGGIAAVRAIAAPFNVKNTSIQGLINELMALKASS